MKRTKQLLLLIAAARSAIVPDLGGTDEATPQFEMPPMDFTMPDMKDLGGNFSQEQLAALLAGGDGSGSSGLKEDLSSGYIQEEAKLKPTKVEVDTLLEDQDDTKKYAFQANTSRLMDIIVNSLYSNREVFLRELISNAADALSKLKFSKMQSGEVVEEQLGIYIEGDKDNHTLTIYDNGIGMSETELVENLGTIAHSGTTAFLEEIANGGDLSMIGQFGVGFYSAFLVADRVAVQSKKLGQDEDYLWKSQASDGFSIGKVNNESVGQGTRITLQLKEDAHKFSKSTNIEKLIRDHSEFVEFPVFMKKKEEWIHVNPAKPIWQRSKDEVTEEEYQKFYKKISKDYNPPAETIVYRGEGELEFSSLLFIPDKRERDIFNSYETGRNGRVKLYSHGILINQDQDLLPPYLSMIHGVVESNDLPLKVDREHLSNSKSLKLIAKRIQKKVIDSMVNLTKKDESAAAKFWDNYKLGIYMGCHIEQDNPSLQKKLVSLIRQPALLAEGEIGLKDYPSSKEEKGDDYDPKADPILYFWGQPGAPVLEHFKKLDKEVLFLDGMPNESCFSAIQEYEGRPLISIETSKANKIVEEAMDEDEIEARKLYMEAFTKSLEGALEGAGYNSISQVEITYRLEDSPSAIFHNSHGVTAAQEKHLRSQAWFDEFEHGTRLGRYVLSINPGHPIVKSLFKDFDAKEAEQPDQFKRGSRLLADYALVSGGHHLEHPEMMSTLLRDSISSLLKVPQDLEMGLDELPVAAYEMLHKEKEDEEEEDKEEANQDGKDEVVGEEVEEDEKGNDDLPNDEL